MKKIVSEILSTHLNTQTSADTRVCEWQAPAHVLPVSMARPANLISQQLLLAISSRLGLVSQHRERSREVGGGRWVVVGGRWEGGGRWEVGAGRWEVGGGRWEVGGGRWEVRGGRWEVGGGRWEVGGGRWEVGGGRWEVGGGRWDVRRDKVAVHLKAIWQTVSCYIKQLKSMKYKFKQK